MLSAKSLTVLGAAAVVISATACSTAPVSSRPDTPDTIRGLTVTSDLGRSLPIAVSRPLVIEVFATWCPFSAYAAAYLVPEFARYVADRGGSLIAVDETDTVGLGEAGPPGHPELGKEVIVPLPTTGRNATYAAILQEFRRQYGIDYDLAFDPKEELQQWLRPVLGSGLDYPTFLFVDGDGRFLSRAVGLQEVSALERTYDQAFMTP